MKKIILAIFISISFLTASQLSDKDYIKKTVTNVTNKIANTLVSNEEEHIKKTKILSQVAGLFDYQLMSKLVLGKRYWNKFNSSQKKQFTSLFKEKLQDTFFKKSKIYKGEKILIDKEAKLKNNKAFINSYFTLNNEKKSILYKFYKSKKTNKWKIYDLEVFNISIIKSYKHQFNDLLRKNSVKEFLIKISN